MRRPIARRSSLFIFPDCRWNGHGGWWRRLATQPPDWSRRSSPDAPPFATSRSSGVSKTRRTRWVRWSFSSYFEQDRSLYYYNYLHYCSLYYYYYYYYNYLHYCRWDFGRFLCLFLFFSKNFEEFKHGDIKWHLTLCLTSIVPSKGTW